MLAAPTAKAAFLINGDTLHQVFAIYSNETHYVPLEGQALKKLQLRFVNIKHVIIDEYSMLSQSILAIIDLRLKQITQLVDKDFGGLSIIFTGDPAQLLPVAATCLYDTNSTNPLNIAGSILFKK